MAFTRLPNAVLAGGTLGEAYRTAIEENWRWIDAFIGGVDFAFVDDPTTLTPVNGMFGIVGPTPTGAFSANAYDLARYNGGTSAWEFLTPPDGCLLGDKTSFYTAYQYAGASWITCLMTDGSPRRQSVLAETNAARTIAQIAYSNHPAIRFTFAGAKTLDVATGGFGDGFALDLLVAGGSGDLTVSASGSQTLVLKPGATLGVVPLNGRATLQLVATDTWLLSGDVT